MDCPACNNSLSHVVVGGVELDVCRNGCGGIWFDTFEFKKFDEPHEQAGVELLDIPVAHGVTVDHDKERTCPKCNNVPLVRHFFSVKKEVEIDTCYTCGGVWLDSGELNNIRGQFASEDEKRAAAAEAFDEAFGPGLERLKKEREENAQSARRFANMLKFILPSYYMAGKQDWGAF